MKKISKGFYLGSIAGAGGLGLVLIIIAYIMILSQEGHNPEIGILSLIPGFLIAGYAGVISLILWYKAWSAIQDGHARTAPDKAIIFLLIPIYNLYWMFQAYWGFAKDYNAYIKRHKVSAQELPEGLFLTTCIVSFSGMLIRMPMLSILLSLVSYTIWIMVIIKVCNALNSIAGVADTHMVSEQKPDVQVSGEVKTSGMAITSLVLSCSGILIGIFGAIPGLILGIISLKKINKSQGRLSGKGLAIAGISVGVFMTLMGLIVLAVLIPALSTSRAASGKATTMANMQAINTAVMVYELDKGRLPQDISELTPEYLVEMPIDIWGNSYVYTTTGADEFEIYSLGSDSVAGTTDDIYLVE